MFDLVDSYLILLASKSFKTMLELIKSLKPSILEILVLVKGVGYFSKLTEVKSPLYLNSPMLVLTTVLIIFPLISIDVVIPFYLRNFINAEVLPYREFKLSLLC